MKKRFKPKKKYKLQRIFGIMFVLLILILLIDNIGNIKFKKSNPELINNILNDSYYSYNIDKNSIIDNLTDYINKNIFNSPLFFLKNELKSTNSTSDDNLNASFSYVKNDLPLVYIYNSHQMETYTKEYLENHNIVPDVLMAANMLKDKLENLNIKTIVEENDILSYMKENGYNHAKSYIASRHFLEIAKNKYSSIQLFIDLHRDAASHSATYTKINEKDYAKILFVIGLENSNYEKNLKVAERINDIVKSKYENLSRGIMKKEGAGVNGVYNQDLDPNVILIEVGGNNNNIDEVNNTLDILANVIGEYLNEKR